MRPNRTTKAVLIILVLLVLASGISFAVVRRSLISNSQRGLESVEHADLDKTTEISLKQFVFSGKTRIAFLHPDLWNYAGSQDSGAGSIGLFYDVNQKLIAQFWIGSWLAPVPLQQGPVSEQSYETETAHGLRGHLLVRTFSSNGNSAFSGIDYWFIHKTGVRDISFYLRAIGQNRDFEPTFRKILDSLQVDASWAIKDKQP